MLVEETTKAKYNSIFLFLGGDEIDSKYLESETMEHTMGKNILFNWIKELPNIHNASLDLWLPETKQRPDIYFESDSKRYVIEYLCDQIPTKQLKERRTLYNSFGIIDIWIFGVDNFNIKRKTGVEKSIFTDQSAIYYIDPFENTLLKQKNDTVYKQNMSDSENFYIQNGNIIVNQQVQNLFKLKLKRRVDDYITAKQLKKYKLIKERSEREERNLLHHRLYKEINDSIKRERKREEEKQTKIMQQELIRSGIEFLRNKKIYLYNDYDLILKMGRINKFWFIPIPLINNTVSKCTLFELILKDKAKLKDEVHIYIRHISLSDKKSLKLFKDWFDNEDVAYIGEWS